jgi:bifunctional oligoribonuclease and PAP phosphatase NrnA
LAEQLPFQNPDGMTSDNENSLYCSDFARVSNALNNHDNFVVTAHIRADGDAIAAICFMSEMLRNSGKTVYPVLQDNIPDKKYSFLAGFDRILSCETAALPDMLQTAIVLDSPTLDRTGNASEWVTRCNHVVCIDHHPGNDGFAGINLVDTAASSTCEILAQLAKHMSLTLTSAHARILYTGILFDTGSFRFSNTTSTTLRTAAELIDQGADPESLNNQLFYKTNMTRIQAMAQTLQSITLLHSKKIAVAWLPYSFFASSPEAEHELEGFSDLAISIVGVRIAVFLKELAPLTFKASLRATGNLDVGKVAAVFKGGGHRKAAGCWIKGEYSNVRDMLLKEILRVNPALFSRGHQATID